MSLRDVQELSIKSILKLPARHLKEAIKCFLNAIEEHAATIGKLKEEIQRLRDENRRLKGGSERPDIKAPSGGGEAEAGDRPEEKCKKSNLFSRWGKSSKRHKIQVTRRERCQVDKSTLPADAQYKGTRSVIIQDIKIIPDNVQFDLERFYSPSHGVSIEAELPSEYQGSEFGPGIWSYTLAMHYQARIPQQLLWRVLNGLGVVISEGQIGQMLLSGRNEAFHEEKEASRQAGIAKHCYQQIDDTGAMLNGENIQTIVTCNEDFTSFMTSPDKARLSALRALVGGQSLQYLIDEFAIDYIDSKVGNKNIVKWLNGETCPGLYTEGEFEAIILGAPFLKGQKETWKNYLAEGCAIAAYRANLLGPSSQALICDDAPQFKGLMGELGLCWVHEARHYKELTPRFKEFQEELDAFLEEFWEFYEQLKRYKEKPTPRLQRKLSRWFDDLFTSDKDYYALNQLVSKTRKKKDSLLLVLKHPEIPLHNNASELDIREKVVQRKIRNGFRSWEGAKASDTFLSLMATCRKQGISFWNYIRDRIYQWNQIPPLDQLILQPTAPP